MPRPRQFNDDEIEYIRHLFENKITVPQIAAIVSEARGDRIPESTIRNYLKESEEERAERLKKAQLIEEARRFFKQTVAEKRGVGSSSSAVQPPPFRPALKKAFG